MNHRAVMFWRKLSGYDAVGAAIMLGAIQEYFWHCRIGKVTPHLTDSEWIDALRVGTSLVTPEGLDNAMRLVRGEPREIRGSEVLRRPTHRERTRWRWW